MHPAPGTGHDAPAAHHTGHDARTLHGRCEYFIYSCWAETQGKVSDKYSGNADGSGVPLYAIKKDGTLGQYPQVKVALPGQMPSGGDFANPEADRPNVKGIEDKMISFFGFYQVEAQCKPEKWDRGEVDLNGKMLRDEHVDALAAALAKYEVASVYLGGNQLGPEGAAKLAEALKTNQTLKYLRCVRPRTPLPRTRQGAPPAAAPHRPSTPAAARRMRAQPGQQQPHRRRQGPVGRAQAGRGGEAEQARDARVRRRPRVLARAPAPAAARRVRTRPLGVPPRVLQAR